MADLPTLELDPCGRAVALRAARERLILGEHEVLIRTRTFDNERELRFGKADLPGLETLIREADEACAVLTGAPSARRRFAMRGGSFGDCNPPYGT